ncbi:MAG: DUF4430 domain-containing protein [Solirubrobacterales bacterium]
MSRARTGTAAALALLLAALVGAGCGLGAGKEVGEATLTVTRDFGAGTVLAPVSEGVFEADTVMRVLERDAKIETRYSGGFVQSIDGLAADEEGEGGPTDWFFYVNGVESPIGAAEYSLHGGEAIWWDYHRWAATLQVPAVVGSWPQPFTGGYDGSRHPVSVVCLGGGAACGTVRERLEGEGVSLARGAPPEGAIRVLVGPWRELKGDPAAAQIEHGPQTSGVFAKLDRRGGCEVLGLDESGDAMRPFGARAGLIAATRRYEDPPTWVVTGCELSGVQEAARRLDSADLRDHFAVAVEPGAGDHPPVALPVPNR